MTRKDGANKHVRQSETARFITRYVPEFLKHFRGSLRKATRSKTFKATPRTEIVITGRSLYANSWLFSAIFIISKIPTTTLI
jgi:hypothetical protein